MLKISLDRGRVLGSDESNMMGNGPMTMQQMEEVEHWG
jgi:hypothetical protein